MYTPITSIGAPAQVGNRLSIVQNFLTNVGSNTNNQHVSSVSEILKEYSRQFDHTLAAQVGVPLGHLSLAAELLESLSTDNDLKMCLDVMTRNSNRINSLVNEFHNFQQAEEMKAGRFQIQ